MGTKEIRLLLCGAILAPLFLSPLVRADDNQPVSLDYAKRLFSDLGDLPSAPLHFSRAEWYVTGGVTAATVVALLHDGEVRRYAGRRRGEFAVQLSKNFKHFGDDKYQVPLQLGSWALGTAFNYTPLKKSAADGMEASLFASGMITPLLTRMSGRALPSYNERPLLFEPFSGKPLKPQAGHESFPSGHTTEAFAIAAVLDANFRETAGYWHTPFLYALAASTGISRIYDGKHYLSDVILGAGIGASVGYWVAGRPRNGSRSALVVSPRGKGLQVTWMFR